VQYCPQAEVLWLMGAKEKWMAGDVPSARAILNQAFAANPDSEEVWLAAVKLESENKEYERARILLSKARDRAGTARVWMKSAKLERKLGDKEKEEKLLTTALSRFNDYPKLYIMMAQLQTEQKKYHDARQTYKRGVKNCPQAIDLWICFAKFEVATESAYSKARSILETARLKNPKTPRLWLAAMRSERQAKKY